MFKNIPFGQCHLAPKYRLPADQKIPFTSFQTHLALSFVRASRTFKLFAAPVKGRKCSEQVSDQKNDLRVMFLKSISGPVVGSALARKEAKCIS